MNQQLLKQALETCRRAALLAGGGLATTSLPAIAQEPPSSFRSVGDVRQRIPDEHDRPYFRETQSHLGFEIREPQFTVIAKTSRADAQAAATHVQASWRKASQLADRWTNRHHQPDFALNSLQVVITNEPPRERDAPLTTVSVVGIQTQVQINVSPGQPPLAEQIVRLRDGAAFAMFHAAGLDAAAPPWVASGLAAYAGRAGLPEEVVRQSSAGSASTAFGGQQWRFHRSAQDRLDYPATHHEESAAQVAFLLTGNDAEHAPAVVNNLRQANVQAANAAAAGSGFRSLPGEAQPAARGTPLDVLLQQQASEFAAWKANPRRGQPVFEPPVDSEPEVVNAQRDLLVLLKLEQRFAAPGPSIVKTSGPKVVQFSREQGPMIVRPTSSRPSWPDLTTFAHRLLDSSRPDWATIDSDGSLLFSSDRGRLEQLLSPTGGRLTLTRDNGKAILELQTNSGTKIRGWLDENPDDKTRPLARFETVSLNKRLNKPAPATKVGFGPQESNPTAE